MSSADNNSIHEKARAALKVKLGKDLRFDIAHKLSYSQEALEVSLDDRRVWLAHQHITPKKNSCPLSD
jgi:hypothetical protein